MKILEEPHQDPQRSLRRSLKILKDLKKIFTRVSPNYTFKVCLQRECGINNEVKNPFMKCLGNNSYLSELFLAGNCNFHCETHIEIAEPCST